MPLVAETKWWNVPQSYIKIGGGKEMSNTESNLSWIRTSDIYEYDVINAFKNFKEIDWRKSSFSVKKGDTVYIYVGKPYSKIMFKTLCVKDDVLPEETIDDRVFYVSNGERVVDNAYIRLRLLDTIDSEKLSLATLNEMGLVKARIQGAYKSEAYPELFEYIDFVFSQSKQLIDRTCLEKYMYGFKEFVEGHRGGYPFLSFEGNEFLFAQEEYKTQIYHEVKGLFNSAKIQKSDIGTGRILELLCQAIKMSQNLIYHINALHFIDKINEFKKDEIQLENIEKIFYHLYFDLSVHSEQTLFNEIKDIFGGNYDVLSYLFYIKDYTRFLPIRSSSFDERFKMLNIDFKTSYNCSWENYIKFISIILEIKFYLEEYYGFSIRPIDAHSFVWMLSSIKEEHFVSFDSNKDAEKNRETKVLARIGQGKYRDDLKQLWHSSCSVTGCKMDDILVASHIKPWRDCTENNEWLNPFNGLLLIPNLDSLFDKGYISFTDDGIILISNKVGIGEYENLGISQSMKLRFVLEEHKVFLRYHRENIFIK